MKENFQLNEYRQIGNIFLDKDLCETSLDTECYSIRVITEK